MPENAKMFHSRLAKLMEDFVAEKRSMGFSYSGGVDILGMLDRLWLDVSAPSIPALNREWAERFIVNVQGNLAFGRG